MNCRRLWLRLLCIATTFFFRADSRGLRHLFVFFFLCTFLFYSVKKKREKQQKQKEDEVLNSYILPPRQNVEPGDELVSWAAGKTRTNTHPSQIEVQQQKKPKQQLLLLFLIK